MGKYCIIIAGCIFYNQELIIIILLNGVIFLD